MRFEIPNCKRCCFCVPLRYGLLVWSYLVLVPLAYDLYLNIGVFIFIVGDLYFDWIIILTIVIWIILTLGNIAFTFLLIVGAHKKSSRLLNVYNKCGVAAAVTNITFYTAIIFYFWVKLGIAYSFVTAFLMELIFVGLQLYILALVRSEIIKLESNFGFQFHNIGAEAEKDNHEPDTVLIVHQRESH